MEIGTRQGTFSLCNNYQLTAAKSQSQIANQLQSVELSFHHMPVLNFYHLVLSHMPHLVKRGQHLVMLGTLLPLAAYMF